jgi:hypothetical protein
MIDCWGVGYDIAERMNLIPQLQDAGPSRIAYPGN